MTDAGPLLVPLQLDAMVIVPMPTEPIRRPTMAYGTVRLFGTPEPQPFGGVSPGFTQSEDNQGVYLMWTLPAALRRATQAKAGGGAVEFKLVPNRWLVVRLHTPKGGGQVTPAAWIVESDHLGDDDGSSYLDPTAKRPLPTTVGRCVPLSADAPWSETSPTATFLTAVGPGNPSFAAFQPHHQNVFSLHDQLAKDLAVGAGTLDYFVAGWYADAAADRLHDWDPAEAGAYGKLLAALQWLAPDPDTRTATSSIYHGLTLGVEWDPDGSPPRSARDDVKPSLALGNSSTDALVGLLKKRGFQDSDAELLEAFTLDLLGVLQQPGGDAILRRELHASWFASATGGIQWQIVDRPTDPAAPRPDPPTADQRDAETKWLGPLNAAQEKLDGQRRQLASLQRELYELWWKRGYANARGMPPGITDTDFQTPLDATQPDSLAGRIQTLIGDIDDAQRPLPDPTSAAAIDQYATDQGLPGTRQLVAGLVERLYQPADPVLVVGGLGHDLVIDPSATLACRYADAVLTAVAGAVIHTVADVEVPAVAATGLPEAIGPLLAEFALLRAFRALDEPGFAKRIVAAKQVPDQASFDHAASIADAVLGTLPALKLEPWSQPWLPLYLEWQADWHPLAYESGGKAQWTLDGDDLAFTGTPPTAPALDKPWGRALLTPGLAFQVRSRLEQYIAANPLDATVKGLEGDLDAISGSWDFLSQTLDGLTTQIAWRDPWATRAPDASIATLVGGGYATPPQPRGAAQAIGYTGLRAGRLSLTRVSIVDRFGQTLELLGTDANSQTLPEIAASLTPRDHAADVAELPPRLLQSGRLSIGSDPICGFLVPNHIDRALAAYDATGRRLGELRLAAVADTVQTVVWDPAPAATPVTLDGLASELGGVLRAVAAAGPAALQNFLTTIDETLWTVDPLAGDRDEYLTALAGRPLALVGAELALELGGEPLRDPSWPATFGAADPPFLGYGFPVRLGAPADREDGLVGYFCDGAYTRFRAARVPAATDLVVDATGFVSAAVPDDVVLTPDGATVARIMLLVDPRGSVQASTGLLPATQLDVRGPALTSALAAISATFRAGPLLADAAAQAPLMPVPVASGRSWAWVEQGGATDFPAVDDRARFSTLAPTAREGFVQVDPHEEPPPHERDHGSHDQHASAQVRAPADPGSAAGRPTAHAAVRGRQAA